MDAPGGDVEGDELVDPFADAGDPVSSEGGAGDHMDDSSSRYRNLDVQKRRVLLAPKISASPGLPLGCSR